MCQTSSAEFVGKHRHEVEAAGIDGEGEGASEREIDRVCWAISWTGRAGTDWRSRGSGC